MKMVELCYSILSFFMSPATDPKGDNELNIP